MKKYILSFFIATPLFFSFRLIRQKKKKITGVWKVIEVQTIKSNSIRHSVFPTESHVIFTQNHYSFCWTSHSTAIRDWNVADSVKLARFNQSIINTGTYELKNSTLITKAIFAMHPMFVNGEARFKCSFAGDTLILTGTSVFSPEKIPNPVYANGAHFVSKLLAIN